jgi:hypothetical protein
MNRRHFLTAMGGATAASMALNTKALAAEPTTAFHAKGLMIVSFEDPEMLRLGLPKAHAHKATLELVPRQGSPRLTNLKGIYSVQTATTAYRKPDYTIPELIKMQELYGNNVRSRITDCPTVISIPYAAIRSITAASTSPTRYTFVRADNGKEIETFRPRKIAESLRIELSSGAVLKTAGKESVSLETVKEVNTEYLPENPASLAGIDAFTAHFPHYNPYLVRPASANFDVLPKNLGPAPAPRVGKGFMPFWPYYMCFLIGL